MLSQFKDRSKVEVPPKPMMGTMFVILSPITSKKEGPGPRPSP